VSRNHPVFALKTMEELENFVDHDYKRELEINHKKIYQGDISKVQPSPISNQLYRMLKGQASGAYGSAIYLRSSLVEGPPVLSLLYNNNLYFYIIGMWQVSQYY
jgi:hypothetical protein